MTGLVQRRHVPQRLKERAPFYDLVPKTLPENLDFRAQLYRDAQRSEKVQHDLWRMCRRDPLFWFNAFCWTLDPRLPPGRRKVPFITYEFQDFCVLDFIDSIHEQTSRVAQKCRDMGVTWFCLGLLHHQWQFEQQFSAGLVSRDYECVVNSGDDAALFTRLEFIRDNQPKWLLGKVDCKAGRWKHLDTGSSLAGEQTTDNAFRAGRYTVVFIDEFAFFQRGMDERVDKASANVTETRWIVSTPNGGANAFAKKCHPKVNDPYAPTVHRLEWTEHPNHVRGLYRSDKGRLEILDRSHPWPKNYPFHLDGKIRSAWYDKKCAELDWVASKIAEELDGDFAGSGNPVFEFDQLLEIAEKTKRPPIREGMLEISDRDVGKPGAFFDEAGGPFRLWVQLDAYGEVEPGREFVMGVDVSKGKGWSNDALCVWDRHTGEKAAQYVDCVLGDYKLAELAVATARLFNDAKMIWEIDGGSTFAKRVEDLGYFNIHFRETGDRRVGGGTPTLEPGWKATTDSKEQVFKAYVHGMMQGRLLNRDEASILECAKFKYADGGGIIHEESTDRSPVKAAANHGDVVTGDMLAAYLILMYGRNDRNSDRAENERQRYNALNHPNPPRGTCAWRHRYHGNRKETKSSSAVFCT